MAQQMYNPFQPMNQAWQGLNQAIVTAGKLKHQRKRNKLKDMLTRAKIQESLANTQSERRDLRQQAEKKQYVNLRRQQQNALQQAYQQEGQAYRQDDEATQLGLAMPASDPMSEPQVDKKPRDFNTIRAELKYLERKDPKEFRKVMGKQIDKVIKLSKQDPEAAKRYADRALDMKLEPKRDGDEIEITTPHGITLTGEQSNIIQHRHWAEQNPDASKDEVINKAAELSVGIEFPQQKEDGGTDGEGLKVKLYHPEKGMTTKAKRGSKEYNKRIENGWVEGTPDVDIGEWKKIAEEKIANNYGKLTDEGFVVNPEKLNKYNYATDLLEKYRQQDIPPKQAATKAMEEADAFYQKLEEIPQPSGGLFSESNKDKMQEKIADALKAKHDTRDIRDFLVNQRGLTEDEANSAIKESYNKYVQGQ